MTFVIMLEICGLLSSYFYWYAYVLTCWNDQAKFGWSCIAQRPKFKILFPGSCVPRLRI